MRRSFILLVLLALAVPGAARSQVAEEIGTEIAACASAAESTLAVLDCTPAPETASEAVADAGVSTLDEAFSAAWNPPADQSLPAWCRLPAKILVYTATDWVRAAQKLASDASLCAEVFLSIPSARGRQDQLPRPPGRHRASRLAAGPPGCRDPRHGLAGMGGHEQEDVV